MASAHPITRFIPTGNLLSPDVFASRHKLLVRLLLAHVPVLFAIGVLRGFDPLWTALEVSPALVAGVAAMRGGAGRARIRAVLVTAGLSWASIVLVHVTGGQIESHFHFFIVLGFIALYQDWLPFTWFVGFTGLSHGLGSGLVPDLVFNHAAGQANPWLWSFIHAGGIAMLSIGLILFWSNTESEQRRATSLATELSERDLERARADIAQRQAQSQMLLNLARRNQSLVQRQLDTIEVLEADEQRPDVLDRLFSLDHMSTRMRRNAESLLVLSGSEPARIWREPIPLSDVLRAAISEVEDYQRVDLVLGEDPRLEGRAAADLSHLFAELVENATTFSPPSTRTTLSAQMSPSGELVIVVRDHGVGMDAASLQEARALLGVALSEDGEARAMTPGDARLGLQVVGLLARRYGIAVEIGAGRDGTTVEVVVPASLVPVAEPTIEPAFEPRSRRASEVPAPGSGHHQAGSYATGPAPVLEPVGAVPHPQAVPTQAGPPDVDLWSPGPEPTATDRSSAFAAFSSRRPATEPAAAPVPPPAPAQAPALAQDVLAGPGLPSLPRRSRDDDVSAPAPVDLWSAGGEQS